MTKRRILLITYSYQPAPSPRAYRWTALAEYWTSQGHDISVVCAHQRGLPAEERCNGVHVHRVGGLLESLKRRLTGILTQGPVAPGPQDSGGATCLQDRPANRLTGAVRRIVTWSYDHTWKAVRWPDYAALWYRHAAHKALELMRRQEYDTLITSSHPFVDHLVGLRLKSAYPKLPWVVDIGDPFCFLTETPCNNRAIYNRVNVWAEGRVFMRAGAISVTNEATRQIYASLFAAARDRIHVIPPLARRAVPERNNARLFSEDDRVRLIFIGRLYASIRSPQHLLSTFARLLATPLGSKLELHFLGWTEDCRACFAPYSALLGNRIILHGPVDHGVARRAMADADVLVNIGNTTAYQLPSKLVEYVQTGKAILNFANATDDSSVMFLRPYRTALTLLPLSGVADEQQWARLQAFVLRPPRLEGKELDQCVKRYETAAIARQYEALIGDAHGWLERLQAVADLGRGKKAA